MTPRPRFTKLTEDKQSSILDAAAEEFAARGYEGASFNKIIERAGISKGAAYYYFEDKEDLYATVFEQKMDQLLELAGELEIEELESEAFWRDLAEAGRSSMRQLQGHPYIIAFFRHVFAYAGGNPDSRVVKAMMAYGRGRIADFLERGVELGMIRDDLPRDLLVELTLGLGLTLDRWLFERFASMSDEEMDIFVDKVTDLYRSMLSPKEKK